jgi:23S rRNA pseudouridine1911/1915/1917 synthase
VTEPPDLNTESVRLVVSDEQAGGRLDAFLAGEFSAHSRVRWRTLINSADVLVNARRSKAAYHVRGGDVITIQFPAEPDARPEPEDVPLDILYEDNRLAVINKPSGLVVHPSKGHWSGTLTAALAYRYGPMSSVGGATRPGIVHRLDRDTSGVIVVARDDQAHLQLARQFEQRTVEKQYFAICRGQLDRDRDQIDQPIGPHPYHREKMAVRAQHPASRPASTFVEVDERFRGFFSLRVYPKTGRTHQIRVHLAHLGSPVLCDPLYSGQKQLTRGDLIDGRPDECVVLRRLALHAQRLSFNHPDDQRRVTYEAPLPQELLDVLAELRARRSLAKAQWRKEDR